MLLCGVRPRGESFVFLLFCFLIFGGVFWVVLFYGEEEIIAGQDRRQRNQEVSSSLP